MKLDDLSYKNALEYEQQKDNVDVTSKLPQEAIKDLVQREFLIHAQAKKQDPPYPFSKLWTILQKQGAVLVKNETLSNFDEWVKITQPQRLSWETYLYLPVGFPGKYIEQHLVFPCFSYWWDLNASNAEYLNQRQWLTSDPYEITKQVWVKRYLDSLPFYEIEENVVSRSSVGWHFPDGLVAIPKSFLITGIDFYNKKYLAKLTRCLEHFTQNTPLLEDPEFSEYQRGRKADPRDLAMVIPPPTGISKKEFFELIKKAIELANNKKEAVVANSKDVIKEIDETIAEEKTSLHDKEFWRKTKEEYKKEIEKLKGYKKLMTWFQKNYKDPVLSNVLSNVFSVYPLRRILDFYFSTFSDENKKFFYSVGIESFEELKTVKEKMNQIIEG